MPATEFEVILTHEHTDFDALASMLAASLLYPDALPVLPRQLNRNVRSFLALYRNRFPFILDHEVPKGRVRRAILVDSHAVNWVKGMDANAELYVIDHHSLDTPLQERYRIWSEPVGANTTLLVEKIIDAGIVLSPLQATLLALGIYEDTGSLTYPSTTHRDARCLAWLLEPEHHVNLEVVAHFLNHPLTGPQRELLQALIDHSEFIEVAGHTVVIAQAQAPGFREELSALATRLRDFHETDAVFMLVALDDVIQLVARSTTDAIDVGAIASSFGGGGHSRAAAAPIHDRDQGTAHVRDQIVAWLELNTRAAVTVQHIMSAGRPQALTPDMTIEAAAQLMRRYGHEGFPVLRARPDGSEEVLGVLTRREADRALDHELGAQPVHKFMRAGNVTIRPETSVSELRRLMIDSNWGQIPVVDATDHVIGIVTRTDLIKLWDEASLPRRHATEIAQRLEDSLAPSHLALLRMIGAEVSCLNYTVYVVGGFVRDLLLNSSFLSVTALDLDIVIEGDAIAFARRLQDLYGGRIVPHRRFSTAKWILDDHASPLRRDRLLADLNVNGNGADLPAHLDFVTARTEFYTAPTVLPTVEDSSIKLDLHRRDFTVNTLALCLNPDRWGELLDFYGGLNDLNHRTVRVLHSLSFVDDPTRILRAVRYEQRFGFHIEPRTLELLLDAVELLDKVTPARIRHELERILQESAPERALRRLQDLGVLDRLHRELTVDAWTDGRFAELRAWRAAGRGPALLQEEPIERYYWGLLVFRLSPAAQTALSDRLALRGETQRLVKGLAVLHRNLPVLDQPGHAPSRVVELLDGIDPTALALSYIACSDRPLVVAYVSRFQREWCHIHPELDGNALAAMGLPRGPIYGEILRTLRAGRLDGTITSRAEEEELARAYLQHEGRIPRKSKQSRRTSDA
jgi:tRNA nucleotidyltransferase (CCA-adding enzyme)